MEECESNFFRKFRSAIFCIALFFIFSSCQNNIGIDLPDFSDDDDTVVSTQLIEKESNIRYIDENGEEKTDIIMLYFTADDEEKWIPFVEIKSFLKTLFENDFGVSLSEKSYTIQCGVQNELLPSSKTLSIDFENGEVVYYNFASYISKSNAVTSTDIVITQRLKREIGEDKLGKPKKIALADYDIPYVWDNGRGYIPMKTAADLIFANTSIIYNGEDLFLVPISYSEGSDIYNSYLKNQGKPVPQSLAQFNYNELCLLLDLHFGNTSVKTDKGITGSFDEWFENQGAKDLLLGTDAEAADKKLAELLLKVIDDGHSDFLQSSQFYFNGKENDENWINEMKVSPGTRWGKGAELLGILNGTDGMLGIRDKDEETQKSKYSFYIKDNTAFINFDEFKCAEDALYPKQVDLSDKAPWNDYLEFDDDVNYASFINSPDDKGWNLNSNIGKDGNLLENKKNYNDTVYLTIFANHFIQTLNSNENEEDDIENVVIDLSTNSGGSIDAMMVINAWFSGEVVEGIHNTIDGSFSAVKFSRADINFDGKIDEKDTVANLKRYCVISYVSFSCGNWMPAILKADDIDVTIVGQQSGGGTCAVDTMLSTATGSIFNLSSPFSFSSNQDGEYRHVEDGVVPHKVINNIDDFENIYNRGKFINIYIKDGTEIKF